MKKVLFLLAVAGMFSFAACNNTNEEAVVEEEATVEEVAAEAVEEVVDSTVATVEEVATEAVAQ